MTAGTGIVHVIQQLSCGGAGRSLVATAGEATRAGQGTHTILSLLPPGDDARALASRAGLSVVVPDGDAASSPVLARADIVQVHYWNTPELDAFLRTPLPASRVLIWSHVAGDSAPHVVTDELGDFADALVVASPYSLGLPVCRRVGASCVLDAADVGRVAHATPRPHRGFVVGYIGTVDPVKMHAEFAAMSAAIDVPDLRVVVYGRGGGFARLEAQVRALGASDRFELRGYVEDVATALAEMDVFGYPLAPANYAASELVIQEAMFVGVPPVVFAHGAAQSLVQHDVTGLVVRTSGEYVAAIEHLYRDPAERRRLGAAAAEYARAHFGAARSADALVPVYDRLLGMPPRPRRPLAWPEWHGTLPAREASSGAARLVASLGHAAGDFLVSLTARRDEDRVDAERRLVRCGPALADAAAGGVLHYRRCYPRDPLLRLWAGLVLQGQGRGALAVAEIRGAIDLGLDHWRCWQHLAVAALGAGANELAELAESESARRRMPSSMSRFSGHPA